MRDAVSLVKGGRASEGDETATIMAREAAAVKLSSTHARRSSFFTRRQRQVGAFEAALGLRVVGAHDVDVQLEYAVNGTD